MTRNLVAKTLKFDCSFQMSYRIDNVAKVMSSAYRGGRIELENLRNGWELCLVPGRDSEGVETYLGLYLSLPEENIGTTLVMNGELRQLDGHALKLWTWTKEFSTSMPWATQKLISKSTLLGKNCQVIDDDAFLLILNVRTLQAPVDALRPQLSPLPASQAINPSLISPSDKRDLKFLNFNTRPGRSQDHRSQVKAAYASSQFLATRTTYFSSHSAFAEGTDLMDETSDSMPEFENTYDYLSDSDLEPEEEEIEEMSGDNSGMANPSDDTKKWKVIAIGDIAHKTWLATLGFLHTNAIQFAPLSTKGAANEAYNSQEEVVFPEASCKSIFRVADKMGIKDLEDHALNFLKSQMDDDTIFHELFSAFTARYDRVKDMECEYLFANWDRLKTSSCLKKMLDEVASGKRPECLWLLPRVFVHFT